MPPFSNTIAIDRPSQYNFPALERFIHHRVEAIAAIKRNLQDPVNAVSDENITTVYNLPCIEENLYIHYPDTLASQPLWNHLQPSPAQRQTHMAGLKRILILRGGIGRIGNSHSRRPGARFFRVRNVQLQLGQRQAHGTTRANLVCHCRAGLAITNLPRTIRDAIAVCRRLAIAYFWVDSLWILQGDLDDLPRELASMPRIYQGALVTIYAGAARAITDGCLQRRLFYYRKFPPVQLRAVGISSRGEQTHTHPVLAESVSADNSYQNLDLYKPLDALDTRGWAYQERFLSPRTLPFGARELSWQCHGTVLRAGSPRRWWWTYHYTAPYRPGMPTPPWEDIVNEYSQCLLSMPQDKLAAIAAVVEVYQRKQGKTYAAGLWKEDLPPALCWLVSASYLEPRPTRSCAPSWSWAVVDGRVAPSPIPRHQSRVEMIEVSTTLGSQVAPLATVVAASLKLCAEMVPAVLEIKVHEGRGELFANAKIISIEHTEAIDTKLDALYRTWIECSLVKLDVWLLLITLVDYDTELVELARARDPEAILPQKYKGLVLRETVWLGEAEGDDEGQGSNWEYILAPEKLQNRTVTIL
ncbi:hypothetical protein B0T18DRAFT_394520 [Schizothecium vesticola]|uniref:Heterokaryon incompatibility domain-containing protein n=1 Tax=Schizothecium vesticola TaxID=314040 RepID=A0AA40EE74_9PEZI|nr:hypothetical protein B0T18DRAFT_394520 [Schizothecium vesticola]